MMPRNAAADKIKDAKDAAADKVNEAKGTLPKMQ